MAVLSSRGNGKIEPGDVGIWATCARGQEGKATEELKAVFNDVCYSPFYQICIRILSDTFNSVQSGSTVSPPTNLAASLARRPRNLWMISKPQ